jgi:ribosomal protein L21
MIITHKVQLFRVNGGDWYEVKSVRMEDGEESEEFDNAMILGEGHTIDEAFEDAQETLAELTLATTEGRKKQADLLKKPVAKKSKRKDKS